MNQIPNCIRLIHLIDNFYHIGPVQKYWFSKYGYESRVLFVLTLQGQFAVKIYQNKNLDDLQVEIDITEHLNSCLFPAPKLVKTIMRQPYAVDHDLVLVIFHFVDGYHLRAKQINAHIAFQLGGMLGRFHSILNNHEFSSRIKKQTRGVTYIDQVHQLLASCTFTHQQINRYIELFNLEYLKLKPYFSVFSGLTQGIIHSDLSMDNILFENSGITFIDFGDSGNGFLVSDLAILVLGIAVYSYGIKDELFKAIFDGYRSCASLSEKELSQIYHILCITCLRKAATYFNYYIHRDFIIYKNIGYLEKLRVLSSANCAGFISALLH